MIVVDSNIIIYLHLQSDRTPQALRALQTMEGREILPPSGLVLDLVATSDCSAYACEYVALARHLNVKLVTGDKKVLDSFPETAFDISVFATIE